AAARRAVALAPEMAEAQYTLGLAELAAGAPGPARAAFQYAIARRRDFPDAWLNLGLAAYRQGKVGAAVAALREALKIDPAHGAAAATLAAFQLLAGDTEAALARLRTVLVRDPDCIPARLNLANALLLEREYVEALAVLDAPPPPGREGRHWYAHRALALIELGRWEQGRTELDAITEPYGDAEILVLWRRIGLAVHDRDEALAATLAERMASAADDAACLPEYSVIGHFDLARFHHRRGRTAEAFVHWTSGHRVLARSQPFSRARLRGFVDATIAHFDANRLAVCAGNADPAPVFVVGMPRSGTTLAEQILAAHPAVFGAGERAEAHRLVVRLVGAAEDAAGVRRLADVRAAALDREAEPYLAALHALAPEAIRVVDKMPGNARHLGFLARLLPGARFIHCGRDPRDIGLSIFQLRFFGYHPYAHDLGDLGFAIAEHARLMAHWRRTLGSRLIDVALTDWIEDFPATLARVLAFLDLPYAAACESFHTQTRRVRTASAAQVRRPINRAGIGRYQAYAAQLGPLFAELERAGLLEQWSASAP
ncbi:MAG: tetratricopeptide repeat-containing sulfotransferase family protein, partial [Acetobacteraceae bacterium]